MGAGLTFALPSSVSGNVGQIAVTLFVLRRITIILVESWQVPSIGNGGWRRHSERVSAALMLRNCLAENQVIIRKKFFTFHFYSKWIYHQWSYLEFPVVGTVYLRARRRGLSSNVVKVSSYTVGCSTSADMTRAGRLWPKTTNGSAFAKSKRSGGASWSTFTG